LQFKVNWTTVLFQVFGWMYLHAKDWRHSQALRRADHPYIRILQLFREYLICSVRRCVRCSLWRRL
jgi:hypothetical protein